MKQTLIHIALLTGLLVAGSYSFGQKPDALINRQEIRIGEQAEIKLSVPINKANPPLVRFPQIGDTLLKQVEVVRKSTIDTLATGPQVKETRLEQRIYITSFDSGYYAIPPFVFNIDGNEVRTEAFLLTVQMVKVDTTKGIVDIRNIYEVELNWRDYLDAYWPYMASGAAIIAVLVAAVVLVLRMLQRQRAAKERIAAAPVQKRPAHELAMERIALTRREKAYSRGRVKQYHTELADALRDYIETVLNIPAHELTTRQIMDRLRYAGLPQGEMQKLRTLLNMADLVKFAKERPDDQQNDKAAVDALQFVEQVHAHLSTTPASGATSASSAAVAHGHTAPQDDKQQATAEIPKQEGKP